MDNSQPGHPASGSAFDLDLEQWLIPIDSPLQPKARSEWTSNTNHDSHQSLEFSNPPYRELETVFTSSLRTRPMPQQNINQTHQVEPQPFATPDLDLNRPPPYHLAPDFRSDLGTVRHINQDATHLARTTSNMDPQRPPSYRQSPNFGPSLSTDFRIDPRVHPIEKHQAQLPLRHPVHQSSIVQVEPRAGIRGTTSLPHGTRVAPGGRSAPCRAERGKHSFEKGPSSTDSPISSAILRNTLERLYPYCKTFGDRMENLIHDYHSSLHQGMSGSVPDSQSLDPQLYESFSEQPCNNGGIESQKAPSPRMSSPDLSDMSSVGNGDDDNEKFRKGKMDLDIDRPSILDATSSDREVGCDLSQSTSNALSNKFYEDSTHTNPAEFLACPFYARKPEAFDDRSPCADSGWPTVHRLKEHIYRSHVLIICPRCSVSLGKCTKPVEDATRLKDHLQQEPACKPGKIYRDNYCSQEKEVELRKRAASGESDVDKWEAMYGVLFPNEEIPLPFFETKNIFARAMLAKFTRSLIAKLPTRIKEDKGKPFLRFGKSKPPGLTEIVGQRARELLDDFIDTEPRLPPVKSQPSKTRRNFERRLRATTRGRTNLTSNGFPMNLPSSRSEQTRRRKDVEPFGPKAKRVDTGTKIGANQGHI